jgi:predicted Zn-dependent protease
MKPLRQLLALLLVMALCLTTPRPGLAFMDVFAGSLTVEKERQVGEEFLLQVQQVLPLVEDAYLTSYINRVGQTLVQQLGAQPFHYRFFIIDDPTMNAFAVPGGYIFITTGLIRQMEREGELAGVLSHEISHVHARHMSKTMEKARIATMATLVAALAAIFLGGAAAQPLLMGGMAAGQSAMLAYSREFEEEADSLGFKWMLRSGYNPRDMITVFRKLNKQRWFEGGDIPLYLSTHPDVDSRLVHLSHHLAVNEGRLPGDRDNTEFQFFAIRVSAASSNPNQFLRRMTQESLHEPQNPAYHYGRALALARLEQTPETLAAFQQALALSPRNYLVQRDLAIYFFQRNRYAEATEIFNELSQRAPNDDTVLYYLGRISQQNKQKDRALSLFEKVHKLNPTFSQVYYDLGTLYGEKGQIGLAHYYLAYHSLKARALPTALFHFKKAMANLPVMDTRYAEVRRQVTRLEKLRRRAPN